MTCSCFKSSFFFTWTLYEDPYDARYSAQTISLKLRPLSRSLIQNICTTALTARACVDNKYENSHYPAIKIRIASLLSFSLPQR